MPIIKKTASSAASPGVVVGLAPDAARDLLFSVHAADRQAAARALVGDASSVDALCGRLAEEDDAATREAIVIALVKTGGSRVVEGLLPLLQADDAGLRNKAIEALQELPHEVAPHMESLLDSEDPDVRIFAVNILEALRHPNVEDWLVAVISTDSHVNVVGTALDLLGEVGTPVASTALRSVVKRFPNEPFVEFAANKALARIGAC